MLQAPSPSPTPVCLFLSSACVRLPLTLFPLLFRAPLPCYRRIRATCTSLCCTLPWTPCRRSSGPQITCMCAPARPAESPVQLVHPLSGCVPLASYSRLLSWPSPSSLAPPRTWPPLRLGPPAVARSTPPHATHPPTPAASAQWRAGTSRWSTSLTSGTSRPMLLQGRCVYKKLSPHWRLFPACTSTLATTARFLTRRRPRPHARLHPH